VVAPIACMQDALRYGAVALRPAAALVSDVLWTLVVGAPIVAGFRLSGDAAVLVWAIGAAGSLPADMVLSQIWPAVRIGVSDLLRGIQRERVDGLRESGDLIGHHGRHVRGSRRPAARPR
jgi:hypothetical protein